MGLLGLALDRTLLSSGLGGPSAASAAQVAEHFAAPDIVSNKTPAPKAPTATIPLRAQLEAASAELGIDPTMPSDAFAMRAALAGPASPPQGLPSEAAAPFGPPLKLGAILTGRDSERTAVINGVLLRTGEMIDGYTLVRIADREVDLERDGVTRTLALSESKR
ncbi:MAG: hypothetical protein JNM07_09700 [Phycisphaerae bacterium]|nr:hypothetical protein [Phycisphaerae bacterium]